MNTRTVTLAEARKLITGAREVYVHTSALGDSAVGGTSIPLSKKEAHSALSWARAGSSLRVCESGGCIYFLEK